MIFYTIVQKFGVSMIFWCLLCSQRQHLFVYYWFIKNTVKT